MVENLETKSQYREKSKLCINYDSEIITVYYTIIETLHVILHELTEGEETKLQINISST